MSYPGSHQQFGLSDLQLLQSQLMLARLQELQKQQQIGQYSDGKSSNSINNLSMLGKHAGGGQFSNLGGTLYNPSGMGASSNVNWMQQNVPSSMQGVPRGSSYSHGEGLMINPSLQQLEMSLYGAPLTSGRGNLGQYTPMQGVSYSSNEKPMSQISESTNSFFGDKNSVPRSHAQSIDGSFMLRQDFQGQGLMGHMLNSGLSSQNSSQVKSLRTKETNDSRGMSTLDPLEEKILFDTEDSSWDISLSKLAALETTEIVEASNGKENMNSFPCIQSGSWSALMQSAVGEASSSDTGIQEELSGLSFQNIESSVEKKPSNIVFNEKQSTSDNVRAPMSSVDSMKSQNSSRWPDCQSHAPDAAGLMVNNCTKNADICEGMIKIEYEFNQQQIDSHNFMTMNEDSAQKDYKSTNHDHQSNRNPMAIDTLYKKAAVIYGNPNSYRGENSCDSYNSKLSQAYVAQSGHGCLNKEDSESCARSSHKSQNQAICISTTGANSQQECFSDLKSTNVFAKNASPMIKGKSNLCADVFSKDSLASDMSASFDSQYTSELDKESQPRDHGNMVQGFNVCQTESRESTVPKFSVSQGAAIPDRFSFQSSVSGDSRLVNLGHGQKGQTWWTPSSFGHSLSPLQGDSGKITVYGNTSIETSNLKSERNSFEGCISDIQHVNHLVDGKRISIPESVQKTFPEMSQYMSLPGFSSTQDTYQSTNANSIHHECTTSSIVSEIVKDLPSSFGLPFRTPAMEKHISDEKNAPLVENIAVNIGLSQRSFSGTTSRVLPTSSQPQVLHNVENAKKQLDITYTNMPGQQPMPEMLSSNEVVQISTQLSSPEYMHSNKLPILQSYSNCNNILYDRMRQLQMRAQIGPLGYVQNEYMKNRSMFSLLDSIKPFENVKGADVSKNYELLPGVDDRMVVSERSLPSSLPLSGSNVHLVLNRPKKRKTAYDCLPWYKKVMTTCQGLPDISTSDEEWAEVTNRLNEKHVDERIEEMRPIFLAKRRLIVTTQLTQMVFRPPPPSVLQLDAGIEYEIVVYSITKLALSDAFGLANVTTDSNILHNNGNIYVGMVNGLSDKVTELLKRTKELETHIERSSKGISVVDILIECQELEKFGIINHFAKYHSRALESSGNTSSSTTSVRPFLQRYVNAVPIPSQLPEGVNCLSL